MSADSQRGGHTHKADVNPYAVPASSGGYESGEGLALAFGATGTRLSCISVQRFLRSALKRDCLLLAIGDLECCGAIQLIGPHGDST